MAPSSASPLASRTSSLARSGIPPSPLPQRDGIDAVRLRMPQDGPWTTLRDHLVSRIPLPEKEIDALLDSGQIVDVRGMPFPPDAPFVPGSLAWVHRDFPAEVPVPFDVEILHADERIVVVDKPHFLATTPRGRHIRETALAHVRTRLDLPRLAPAHRLDRLTAGVLVFTTEQRWRGAYQRLFAGHGVRKEYLARAPVRPELTFPTTVRVHLSKPRGQLQSRVLSDQPPNSETLIDLLEDREGVGLYRLVPSTGRTHQLRAHLSWLGIPVCGDPLYPDVTDPDPADFSVPLALVASSVSFTDPVDGTARCYVSLRRP